MAKDALVIRTQKRMPTPANVARAAEMFAALGDPTRVRVVAALACAEMCVRDLALVLRMSVSAVSHQLRVLRHLGLVKYRKAGRHAYYSLDDEHASAVLKQMLDHVRHAPALRARQRK